MSTALSESKCDEIKVSHFGTGDFFIHFALNIPLPQQGLLARPNISRLIVRREWLCSRRVSQASNQIQSI